MGGSRRRRAAVWSLLVAGAVTTVLAIFAVWAARQLLDEDQWEATNVALIADPAVEEAVATYLVDELYEHADPAAALRAALPPRLQPLADPAAGALRVPLTDAVRRLLRAPRVQALWAEATRLTHQQLVNLVHDRGPALRTQEGAVVLDLRPILGDVGQQLGLPITGDRLPAGAGRIVIMSASDLQALQRVVRLLQMLALALFLLAVLLLALAVALARGRRRETLADAALAVIVAAILVLLLRGIVGDTVVEHLAGTATARAAADAVWTIGTSLLAQIARTLLLLGALLALSAWLAGPARLAGRVRSWARPALAARPELVHGVLLALLLGSLAAGIVPGVRTLAAAVLLMAVSVGGVELVRRQAVRESA